MWTRKTGRFAPNEMGMLERMSAAELTAALLGSDPLVALRGLAEVMLNGDDAKLTAMLANSDLRAHWAKYESDREVDARDRNYAEQIRQRQPR
jgi:hypothetical protein